MQCEKRAGLSGRVKLLSFGHFYHIRKVRTFSLHISIWTTALLMAPVTEQMSQRMVKKKVLYFLVWFLKFFFNYLALASSSKNIKCFFTKPLQQSWSAYSLKQQDVAAPAALSHCVTNCNMLLKTSNCRYVYNFLPNFISLTVV